MTKVKTGALVAVLITVALGIFLLAHFAWRALERRGTARHQGAIIRELASWESEFSRISNDKEAFRAVNLLSHVGSYYKPGPGYHSDPDTEFALEAQRTRTIRSIVKALEDYTGEKHRDDPRKWEEWRDKKKNKTGIRTRDDESQA